MYKTCIYCHRNLGENESVENFPVGRRLAFDAEKGRLWVVCDNCRRWNLTPLEERWEAIEECERYYRDTTIRYSTDNIGLAQLGEGLDLVRIGKPQRPEFAAWRYGRQFMRRRLVRLAKDLSVAAGAVAAHVLGVNAILWLVWMGSKRRVVARVRLVVQVRRERSIHRLLERCRGSTRGVALVLDRLHHFPLPMLTGLEQQPDTLP